MSATVAAVAVLTAAAACAAVDIGGHRGLSRHELMELDLATSVAES